MFNLIEVLEPVSIVFNTSSRILPPGMPFDWSIATIHFNAYVSHSTWRAPATSSPGRFSLTLEPGKSALGTRLARRVLQTREVYETLLQRTFWRFDIWHFEMRNGFLGHWLSSVWLKVFKKMLKGSPFLSSRRFFARSLFHCSLSFHGSSALTKSLAQATLQISSVKMCETQ